MEALTAISGRRSIRRFAPGPVGADQVKALLTAAMSAPSAGNQQPWHFVVTDDASILARVPAHHPYASMVPSASLAVLVCGDLQLEKFPGFWVQDCAAATENLLVAAHALGLGAVWLGVHPMPDRENGMRRLFELPDEVIPFALIPIGRPAEEKPATDRYQPLRVYKDRWGTSFGL
ncbi:MAG TPA: nitroreductase family protein [Candidatus Ozemobacteraceae bacterium]|nr:nitroreductase family protein [Candidatus Ozemobacteraceae bacterium]